MKMLSLILFIGLLWLTASPANAEASVYELILKGNQCQENPRQSLECEDRIGKTLHIALTGIGQTDAGITFKKRDFNRNFDAAIAVLRGCVIVKCNPELINLRNAVDFALIAPRTGMVYRTWEECESGM